MIVRSKKARAPVLAAFASLVAVGALAFSAASTGASGLIMVHGADSSASHLRVTTSGNNIVVDGFMSDGTPEGCHVTKPRSAAVCPTAGMSAMEIDMGPMGDKVEVLDPLPVPLTVYLGNGSDKFIGNAEPDTCYPQGARRNRCYGGAGNDICITGPRNSDCVGDGGYDYCKHETGSDGCWGDFAFGADAPAKDDPMQGEPGNDICFMGPGKDGCHGGPGDDILHEGSGSGKLYGESGDDRLYGGGGADKLYGGSGHDYCNGQGRTGKSYECEYGPGH